MARSAISTPSTCTQGWHTGPLMPSEVGRPIPYIDPGALDFPELVIVCGHIGFDRAFGYCLKSPEGFRFTHLGKIGRGK